MTTGQRFSGYPARFGYATSQVMDVTQMVGFDLDANNTKSDIIPSGAVDRAAVLTPRMRPQFRLRTQDMATVLAVVDIQAGKCFDETSTFFMQERADCGTFLSTATDTHPGRATEKGYMHIDSITAEQDSEEGAMLNCIYTPLKKAGSNLVTYTTDPLTATTVIDPPAYVSSYFLGPVYHTGSEIPGVMGVTLNFNNNIQASPSSPGAFDDLVSVVTRTPELSFRCLKIDAFDAFSLGGDPVATSFAFYFQKADATNAVGDGRVAVASAVHVKVSGTAGDIETRSLSVDGNDDAAMEVIIRPTGTLSISVASAIP